MKHDLIIAGFGGQGILFAGQLMAYAGMLDGLEVSWMPSYGPEMRGGTANCTVVLSREKIRSPLVTNPRGLIAMNKPSLEKFVDAVRPGGVVVLNSGMVDIAVKRKDIACLELDADALAVEAGSSRVANLIALGAYLQAALPVKPESVFAALEKVVPEHRFHLLPVNRAALRKGMEVAETLGGGVIQDD